MPSDDQQTGPAKARALLGGCLELYAGNRAARQAELPPHDLDAEAVVLSSVLWGERRPSQLGVRRRWLYSPDNRCTWAVLEAVEEMGTEAMVAWGGDTERPASCRALGTMPNTELVATALADGAGHGPLWYWRARLRRLMQRPPFEPRRDPERCARIVRDRARERALLWRLGELEAALRRGERPDYGLVLGALAGLLRMRQAHRWEELETYAGG